MKKPVKSLLFLVVIAVIVAGVAFAIYNRPSEKILKLTALAERGDANAQFELGNKYLLELEGVSLDYSEAMKWYSKSAEQGNAAAQDMLGFMYERGLGVYKDLVQAYMWDNLATIQDKKYAKFRDRVKGDMTIMQIEEGDRLTNEWKYQHPELRIDY